MTYYEHSLLSVYKFGNPELFYHYFLIHKFLDSSKLLLPNLKHRLLLHNTYGVELSIKKFGDHLPNGVLTRDVAFEHLREDHSNVTPTLVDWYKSTDLQEKGMEYKDFFDKVEEAVQESNKYRVDLTWVNDINFKERWCYSPNKKDILWLNSEERCLLEKEVLDLKTDYPNLALKI